MPDGTIIITDAMILQSLGKADNFGGVRQAHLTGVLAHELGHIEQRHSVRVMARSSLTAAASAALFGDFSAVAAGVPAIIMNMHYSRDTESDADGYAIVLLKKHGLSTAPLADRFDALEKVHAIDPSRKLPRRVAVGIACAASHPASSERSERLWRGTIVSAMSAMSAAKVRARTEAAPLHDHAGFFGGR